MAGIGFAFGLGLLLTLGVGFGMRYGVIRVTDVARPSDLVFMGAGLGLGGSMALYAGMNEFKRWRRSREST